MPSEVGTGYITVWPNVSGISSGITSALNGVNVTGSGTQMGNQVSSGITGALSTAKIAIGNAIGNVISAGLSAITSSVDDAISRVDTLNIYPKVMQQMGFSAEEASASVEKLDAGIAGLPTTLDDITDSAKQITLALGDIDVGTDAALALNDALYASGATAFDASRGMRQFIQIISNGKVDGQSWRTLSETMPAALKQISESFGYATYSIGGDFYTALQNGEIGMDEFLQRMIELDTAAGGFADQAAIATGSISTSMTIAKTAVVRNLGNIIDAINGDNDLIINFFLGLRTQIDNVGSSLVSAVPVVKGAIGKISDAFETFYVAAQGEDGRIDAVFKQLTIASVGAKRKVADAIIGISSAFDGAVDSIAEVIGRVSDLLAAPISAVQKLSGVFGIFADYLPAALTSSASPAEKLASAMDSLQGACSGFANLAAKELSVAAVELKDAFEGFPEPVQKAADKVSECLESIATAFANATTRLDAGSWGDSLLAFAGTAKTALEDAKAALENAKSSIEGFASKVKEMAGLASTFVALNDAMHLGNGNTASGILNMVGVAAGSAAVGINDAIAGMKASSPVAKKLQSALSLPRVEFTKVSAACGNVKSAFGLVDKAGASMADAFSSIGGKLSSVGGDLYEFSVMADRGKTSAARLAGEVPGLQTVLEALTTKFQPLNKAMYNAYNSGMTLSAYLRGEASAAFDALGKKVAPVTAKLSDFYGKLGVASSKLSPVFSRVSTEMGTLFAKITGHLSSLTGTFEGAFSRIASAVSGSAVSGALAGVGTAAESTAGKVAPLATSLEAVSTKLAPVGTALATVSAKLSPIGEAIGRAVGTVTSHLPSLASVSSVFEGLSGKLAGVASIFGLTGGEALGLVGKLFEITNPIGLIISSMVSMTATDEGFRNDLIDTASNIMSSLWPALQSIGQMLLDVGSTIIPVVLDVFDQLTPVLANLGLAFLQVVAAVAPFISQLVSSLAPVITQIVTAVAQFVEAAIPVVVAAINTVISIIQALMPVLEVVLSVVVTVISVVISIIGTLITTVVNIATIVASVVGIVASWLETAFATVSAIFESIWSVISGVMETVGSIISSVVSTVCGIFNDMFTTVTGIFSDIASKVSETMNNIVSGIQGVASDIYNAVSGAFQGAIDFITGLADQALQWGKDIIQGIIDGITGMASAVGDAVSGIAGTIASFLGFSEPDEGPLSNFHTFMPDMMKLMAEGIEGNTGLVEAAASTAAGAVSDAISGASGSVDMDMRMRKYASADYSESGGNTYVVNIDGLNLTNADEEFLTQWLVSKVTDWKRVAAQ